MNIPPDQNDLNRADSGFLAVIKDIGRSVYEANKEWTSAKDMAVRFAVPFIGMAMTALLRQHLQEKREKLQAREERLSLAEKAFQDARREFLQQKKESQCVSISTLIDDLMPGENAKANQAHQEIEEYQPMIRKILAVRCSPSTPRAERIPTEKELQVRLVRHPSPFDDCGALKETIMSDLHEVYHKDIQHCDYPWPIGKGNNGELYKVYKKNWQLQVELEKYKRLMEKLRTTSVSPPTPDIAQKLSDSLGSGGRFFKSRGN